VVSDRDGAAVRGGRERGQMPRALDGQEQREASTRGFDQRLRPEASRETPRTCLNDMSASKSLSTNTKRLRLKPPRAPQV
jgi:hypothetical protein